MPRKKSIRKPGLLNRIAAAKNKETRKISAVNEINKSINMGYGKIDFPDLIGKAELVLDDLVSSMNGEEDRTNLLMSMADLFFSFVLSYDGSGKTHLHPSSFMEDCTRKLYYDLTNTEFSDNPQEEEISPNLQRIFDVGHIMHLYIQFHLSRAGVLESAETNIRSDKYRILGKTDGVVVFYETEKLILEIKTANSMSYRKAKKEPFLKHKKQASVYAKYGDYDRVLFVYLNKDTQEMCEHIYYLETDIEEQIEDKTSDLQVHIDELNAEPKRSCSNHLTQNALACPYRSVCFKLNEYAEN